MIASILLLIPYMLSATKSKVAEMLKEYECGFNVFDSAAKLPFDVQFYIVGLLFLIFDLEVATIFP
ncbi:MAG: NADH-quinone oxidoreductase subunit A [Gammaproteobacteria bacterium]